MAGVSVQAQCGVLVAQGSQAGVEALPRGFQTALVRASLGIPRGCFLGTPSPALGLGSPQLLHVLGQEPPSKAAGPSRSCWHLTNPVPCAQREASASSRASFLWGHWVSCRC